MIQQNSIFLKITKNENNEFKISVGKATEFVTDRQIIVGDKNPNLLWNLLYDLTGIPLPVHVNPQTVIKEFLEEEALKNPPKNEIFEEEESLKNPPPEGQPPAEEKSDIEKELSALSASEIVCKVMKEKGIGITNSLKSKAAILRKALKIYEK